MLDYLELKVILDHPDQVDGLVQLVPPVSRAVVGTPEQQEPPDQEVTLVST